MYDLECTIYDFIKFNNATISYAFQCLKNRKSQIVHRKSNTSVLLVIRNQQRSHLIITKYS